MRLRFVALFLCGLGCGGSSNDAVPAPDEYFYDCEDHPPQVTVFATDESFRAIVDKETAGAFVTDDTRAAVLVSPPSQATLSVDLPPTFQLQWSSVATALFSPKVGTRAKRSGWWLRAWNRISPIGTAHAHCAGVTGDNVLFRLESTSGTPLYTTLLSVTSFTPDPAIWKDALHAQRGKNVTLVLARAVFSGGQIVEGPFVSASAPGFHIAP